MKKLALFCLSFVLPAVHAQTINPNQIRPSQTNGQVVTTVGGVSTWAPVVSGSQRVVYTSVLLGTTGDAVVAPGSTTTGTDHAAAINAALSGGNIKLIVDGQYGLSTSLIRYSDTSIECLPGMGFIMQNSANAPVLINAHQNAPTVSDGNGGYVVSNITDQNLVVKGCVLNQNSTGGVPTGTGGSVTGQDTTFGGSYGYHKVNPATGKWVYAVQDAGVLNDRFEDNTIYDSGTFALFTSNVENLYVVHNHIFQPTPLALYKNTDAVHPIGPLLHAWVDDNWLQAGDDTLAFNADDGNRPCEGDPSFSFVNFPFALWGPEVDLHVNNNFIDGSVSGVRLYSATSRMDQIFITKTAGSTTSIGGSVAGAPGCGVIGNFGDIHVDGWPIQPDGTTSYPVPQANWAITGNTDLFEFNNDDVDCAPTTKNQVLLAGGAVNVLRIRGMHINGIGASCQNPSPIAQSGGSINQIVIDGLDWQAPPTATATVLQGVQPNTVTFSNYSGGQPIDDNNHTYFYWGDAFTNNGYTTYIQSSFNEGSAGATVVGTKPAVYTGTGTWTSNGVGTYQFLSGGGLTQTTTISGSPEAFLTLDVGHSDYTFTTDTTGANPATQVVFRYTDPNNFVGINFNSGMATVFDEEGGTTSLVCNLPSAGTNGFTIYTSGLTIVVGNVSTSGAPSSCTGQLPFGTANLTSTLLGYAQFSGSGKAANSLSVITSAGQSAFIVTNNGTSGPATLSNFGHWLNIPNYSAGASGVPTINGVSGPFTFTGSVSCAGTTCNFTGGGGGSGTVTSVTSADANATIANTTTTPVITIVAAPKLATARTINSVSFDGTANITVPAAANTLTGTTLPALNGAALTGLTFANIGPGTAPTGSATYAFAAHNITQTSGSFATNGGASITDPTSFNSLSVSSSGISLNGDNVLTGATFTNSAIMNPTGTATGAGNFPSTGVWWEDSYWDGTTHQYSIFSFTNSPGTGTNPANTLTLNFSNSGTTTSAVSIPFATGLGTGSTVNASLICTVANALCGSGSMVYPAAGVGISTGSAWTTSLPVNGAGGGLTSGPTSTATNDAVCFTGSAGQIASCNMGEGKPAQLILNNTMTGTGNIFTHQIDATVGTAIASATTIAPITGIVHITGTTAIATITPPTGMSSTVGGCIQMIFDAGLSTTTAGNIFAIYSPAAGSLHQVCYDGSKWYIN